MAKIAAVMISLILLGSWGYFAWQQYVGEASRLYTDPAKGAESLNVADFARYLTGFGGRSETQPVAVSYEPAAQANVRIALGAIAAFSGAMLTMAFLGGGAIFSISFAAFTASLTAMAHLALSLSLLVRVAWALFGPDPIDYSVNMYGIALYSALTSFTAVVLLARLKPLMHGQSTGMTAVIKCLLVLLVAGVGLAPLGVPAEFVVSDIHGLYWLAGLCLATLALLGLTHSNYRYD